MNIINLTIKLFLFIITSCFYYIAEGLKDSKKVLLGLFATTIYVKIEAIAGAKNFDKHEHVHEKSKCLCSR